MSDDKFAAIEAVKEGKTLLAKSIIEKDPSKLTIADEDGRTVFHWACLMNNPELIKFLVKQLKDVDIDDLVDESGWTPLHIAASLGNVTVFTTLMEMDPQPDVNLATATTGITPLHLAVSKNHVELVQLLVNEFKAQVLAKDKRGTTALLRAASIGSLQILTILAKKSNLNAKDKNGWTAMHHALAEGHGDFAVKLVELGADPSIVNDEGLEPYQVSVDDKVAKFFKLKVIKESV